MAVEAAIYSAAIEKLRDLAETAFRISQKLQEEGMTTSSEFETRNALAYLKAARALKEAKD